MRLSTRAQDPEHTKISKGQDGAAGHVQDLDGPADAVRGDPDDVTGSEGETDETNAVSGKSADGSGSSGNEPEPSMEA